MNRNIHYKKPRIIANFDWISIKDFGLTVKPSLANTSEQRPSVNRPKSHPTKASTNLTLFIWATYKQRSHSDQRSLLGGPKVVVAHRLDWISLTFIKNCSFWTRPPRIDCISLSLLKKSKIKRPSSCQTFSLFNYQNRSSRTSHFSLFR